MKQKSHRQTLLISTLAFSLVCSFALCVISNRKHNPSETAQYFQTRLQQHIHLVDQQLAWLKTDSLPLSELKVTEFSKNHPPTALFLYENGSLRAWSTNQFSFRFPALKKSSAWTYEKSSNVHALYKWLSINDSTGILAMIPLKWAFPYENQYLKNTFISPFDSFDTFEISTGRTAAHLPIYDSSDNYLFSIIIPTVLSPNPLVEWLGLVTWSLSFLLSLLMFVRLTLRRNRHPLRFFLLLSLFYSSIIAILSYYSLPRLLFVNPLFSSHHFTVNPFITSFTHLTLYVFWGITLLFSYFLKFRAFSNRWINPLLLAAYLWLLIEFLRSIVLHSDIQFNFYIFNQVTFVTIWVHFLLFLLLLAGFTLFHTIAPRLLPVRLSVVSVFLIITTLLSLGVTHHLHQHKKLTRYKVLTENIRINGTSRQDPMTELLLEELAQSMVSDTTLSTYLSHPDSLNALYTFVNRKYTSLLNEQYDIEIELINTTDDANREYLSMLQRTGIQVGTTNFYNLPASLFETSYAGFVVIPDSPSKQEVLYLEFRNKRNFRSYSFPDLLINESTASQLKKDISIAGYEKGMLVFDDQKFDWPDEGSKFRYERDGFAKIELPDGVFYCNQFNKQQLVIAELSNPGRFDKIFYFILIVVVYLLLARILIILAHLISSQQPISLGLTGKFQIVFVFLLMVSFISTLLFSVQYFRRNYEQEQLQQSTNKRQYIQSSLQETFYWLNDITAINEQGINSILQELAFRYQTDIHLYNQHGELAGSSQNLLFSKQLISKLIDPEVRFAGNTSLHRLEKIGELTYLTSYTQLLNGDFVPLGYIAIPQFFSQTEINSKIDQFLMAVVQIYTLVIILSILLLLLAGNRLANPLRIMEEKLKTMKLNGRNSKIEYRGYDEIGQLVEQYNRTVDELERSTQLLLQTERESAWRTMARQVAHEINNPLTPMKLTIQQLQRVRSQAPDQFDEYFRTTTTTLIEQIDNLSRIAGTFSQFARLPETEMQTVDVAARLYSTVELFKANSEEVEVVYKGVKAGLMLKGDPEQLSRVFTNLLKNALQSIPAGRSGKIKIELSTNAYQQVVVMVSDNGSGISEEASKNIFKPDFTTKSSGMGLGLSISRAIIENSGGTISFDSEVDRGTTFTIVLPLLS